MQKQFVSKLTTVIIEYFIFLIKMKVFSYWRKTPKVWCRDGSKKMRGLKVPIIWKICIQQLLKNYYYTGLCLADVMKERQQLKRIRDISFISSPLYKIVLLTAKKKVPVFIIFKRIFV
ncbi:MAG: hypothetical protein CMO44_17725 [Verrucomicrobiales bacterium]|nr:hypothetical protein [Verrucomicrobiales bacterium]